MSRVAFAFPPFLPSLLTLPFPPCLHIVRDGMRARQGAARGRGNLQRRRVAFRGAFSSGESRAVAGEVCVVASAD
eukprot:5639284-Pyramimonas_sp.AAC.1